MALLVCVVNKCKTVVILKKIVIIIIMIECCSLLRSLCELLLTSTRNCNVCVNENEQDRKCELEKTDIGQSSQIIAVKKNAVIIPNDERNSTQ